MNKVILMGRLTADPDVGSKVAKYRLAVDRAFKQEGQPTADFISCVVFGKGIEFVSKYLHKGTKIAVEGRIQTGSYDKDNGTRVYTTDVIVDRHEFCESRSSGGSYAAPSAETEPDEYGFSEVSSDDIPF